MSKNRQLELAAIIAATVLLHACAWIADLGPAKQRRSGDTITSAGGLGGSGDTTEAGAFVAGSAGADDEDIVLHPAVGRLLGLGDVSCTASVIGPRTAVTAASCLPAWGRGCDPALSASDALSFTLELKPPRTFHVRAFLPFPQAFPSSDDESCSDPCSTFGERSIADVRRGRDLALIYLSRDSEQHEPGDFVTPLRVLTEPEQASAYLDIQRDFTAGSDASARVVGFATESDPMRTPQLERLGHFDLGSFWDIGCEQAVSCSSDENRRNRCPALPFGPGAGFYEDNVLRVLDVADQTWLSSFSKGSSGAALLLERGAGQRSLSTLDTSEDTLIGVLSDTEPSSADRASERPAAYFGSTFAAEVGGWLKRKIGDFDSDCIPDNLDASPTVSNASSACWDTALAADWSSTSLERQIAAPTPPALAWSPRAVVAAAPLNEQRLDLFVVAGDGTLYRARATPNSAWKTPKWSAWTALSTSQDLRGELSAVPHGDDVSLFALTEAKQLRRYGVNTLGETSEELAPRPPSAGFSSGPSALVTPFGGAREDLDLFIRGSAAELLRYEQRAGVWKLAQRIAQDITSAPVACAAGPNIELFARSSDFHLLHWTLTDDGGPSRFTEDLDAIAGVPAAYCMGTDRFAVLSRDETGALLQRSYEGSGSGWSATRSIGVHLLTDPVPVVPAAGYVQVFGYLEPGALQGLTYSEP